MKRYVVVYNTKAPNLGIYENGNLVSTMDLRYDDPFVDAQIKQRAGDEEFSVSKYGWNQTHYPRELLPKFNQEGS